MGEEVCVCVFVRFLFYFGGFLYGRREDRKEGGGGGDDSVMLPDSYWYSRTRLTGGNWMSGNPV